MSTSKHLLRRATTVSQDVHAIVTSVKSAGQTGKIAVNSLQLIQLETCSWSAWSCYLLS